MNAVSEHRRTHRSQAETRLSTHLFSPAIERRVIGPLYTVIDNTTMNRCRTNQLQS